MKRRLNRRALTLLELLVILGILTMLMALVIPAVQKVRAAAGRLYCANNLRQIGVALHSYHGPHRRLPTGVSYRNGVDPYPHMSWHTRLLPYIEQDDLWQQATAAFAKDKFFRNSPPHSGLGTVLKVYGCPEDGRTRAARNLGKDEKGRDVLVAFSSYLGITGASREVNNGVFYLDSATRLTDIQDGSSQTLMVGERPPSTDGNYGWWYAGWGQAKDGTCDSVLSVRETNVAPRYQGRCPYGPYTFGPGREDEQCDAFHFWSFHPGGAHFLLADGSVRFLTYSADELLPALASRNGGEVVALPE